MSFITRASGFGEERDGAVVLDVGEAAEDVAELLLEVPHSGRVALLRGVGVREILHGDENVRECGVERAGHVEATTSERFDARDAVRPLFDLNGERHGRAVDVDGVRIERDELRLIDLRRVVAARVGVADGVVRGARHVLAERVGPHTVADDRVHLFAEGRPHRHDTRRVEVRRTPHRQRAEPERERHPTAYSTCHACPLGQAGSMPGTRGLSVSNAARQCLFCAWTCG